MLDCECYDLMKENLRKTLDGEVMEEYFKRAAQSILRTLKMCIEENHAYADFWNDFEQRAMLYGLASWRLANAQMNMYEKLFNDFEDYVKEQLEKDTLRRKLKDDESVL